MNPNAIETSSTGQAGRSLSRRRALQAFGLGAAGLLLDVPWARSDSAHPQVAGTTVRRPAGYDAWLWSDPRSWPGGRVPGPREIAKIGRPIVLDVDATVAGVQVEQGGALVFAPHAARTLQSAGNVVVAGQLVMRPISPAVSHRLAFTGVDESKVVGGGMEVLASDVGLWVVHNGLLDCAGAAKQAWTRAVTGLRKGERRITVENATGWQVGDLVAITPTGAPTLDNGKFRQDVNHTATYDEAKVAAVAGNVVTLDRGLAHDHPLMELTDWTGGGRRLGAEVLNLSRNVVIEGKPTGRAHVMLLHAMRPQRISHVELRHVGPRKNVDATGKNTGAVGRYGLHFHHCGDASRGSVVEGVVIHRCGNHAFVPHDSHGVTLRDCVAHDVQATAFWWDLHERKADYHPRSDDSLWERCLASKVVSPPKAQDGYRLAGFNLSEGKDGTNRCVQSLAVGVQNGPAILNSSMSSGFHWTEGGRAVWGFSDCLAHNIGGSGILSWQNDEKVHVIEKFIAYHCGKSGIDHGAYSNFWQYRDLALVGNRRSGLAVHAVTRRTKHTPKDAPPLRFENLVVDGRGISSWGIQSEGHRFAANAAPTVISRARVSGCRKASIYEPNINNASNIEVLDSTLGANEFWISDQASTASKITVRGLNGRPGSFVLRRKDQKGQLVRQWNARRANS